MDYAHYEDFLEGVQVLDREWRYRYLNPAAERQSGQLLSDLLGRDYRELWPGGEAAPAGQAIAAVLAGGPPRRFVNEFRFPGGRVGFYELLIQPWDDGVMILSLDVSDRRPFGAVFGSAPIPMSLTDVETNRIVEVNESFCRLLGRTREDLLGRLVPEVPFWRNPDRRDEMLRELAAQGRVAGFEAELVHQTGRALSVLLFVEIVPIGGRPTVLIQGLDRTELQSAEERYRLLAENISDVVWILDLDSGRYRYVSPSVVALRGYSVEEVLAQSMAESITAESARYLQEILPGRLGDWHVGVRKDYVDLIRQPHRDGRIIVTETTTRFVRHSSTGRIEVFGSSRDITARQAAEDEKARSEERYRNLFDTTRFGIAVWDEAGRLVLGNRRFLEQLRHPDPIGRPIEEVFAPRAAEVLARVAEVRAARESRTYTTKMTGETGTRWMSITYQPLFDAAGAFTGTQTLGQDVTESETLNRQLFEVERKQMIAVLAGGLAHDLNNLLAGLQGHIELASLSLDGHQTAKAAEHLDKARNAFRRTRNLTRQLLSFSKERSVHKEVALLGARFREWAEFPLAGADQELHLDVPPNLWACECDQEQIGQVVDNLLINARQASPPGGRIWLTARNLSGGEPMVEVTIEDEGPGIAADLLPRVFEPFFTTKDQGSGLGLASSRTVIEDHGGQITADRSPRGGARFTVTLPALRGSRVTDAAVTGGGFQDSGTALVMDDDPVVRETVAEVLEAFGYTVLQARNGQDALAYWEAEHREGRRIKVAILDLTVPGGLGGRETARRMTGQDHSPILVGMTGYSATGSDRGNDPFATLLAKPFSIRQIGEALSSVVR